VPAAEWPVGQPPMSDSRQIVLREDVIAAPSFPNLRVTAGFGANAPSRWANGSCPDRQGPGTHPHPPRFEPFETHNYVAFERCGQDSRAVRSSDRIAASSVRLLAHSHVTKLSTKTAKSMGG